MDNCLAGRLSVALLLWLLIARGLDKEVVDQILTVEHTAAVGDS